MATRLPDAQPEPALTQSLEGSARGKEKSPVRPLVRIIRYSYQLLDADNLWGSVKPLLDQLRYAGLIPEDGVTQIELQVEQVKVRTRKETGTKIIIE